MASLHIHKNKKGDATTITMDPRLYKVTLERDFQPPPVMINPLFPMEYSPTRLTEGWAKMQVRGTVFETIPLVFTMTAHENNACQLLLKMQEHNPLKVGQDPKQVPLFRFPESAGKLAGQVLHPILQSRQAIGVRSGMLYSAKLWLKGRVLCTPG